MPIRCAYCGTKYAVRPDSFESYLFIAARDLTSISEETPGVDYWCCPSIDELPVRAANVAALLAKAPFGAARQKYIVDPVVDYMLNHQRRSAYISCHDAHLQRLGNIADIQVVAKTNPKALNNAEAYHERDINMASRLSDFGDALGPALILTNLYDAERREAAAAKKAAEEAKAAAKGETSSNKTKSCGETCEAFSKKLADEAKTAPILVQ